MTSPNPSTPARGLNGRHVLGAMLTFFAVIIVADATMIYSAISTFGGVDNTNAYREGLAYNSRIARAQRQSELGWTDKADVLTDPARLRVSFADATGSAVTGLTLTTNWARPATNRSDTVLAFRESAPGVYEVRLDGHSGSGAWIANVKAFRNDETEPVYLVRRRLWIAP